MAHCGLQACAKKAVREEPLDEPQDHEGAPDEVEGNVLEVCQTRSRFSDVEFSSAFVIVTFLIVGDQMLD